MDAADEVPPGHQKPDTSSHTPGFYKRRAPTVYVLFQFNVAYHTIISEKSLAGSGYVHEKFKESSSQSAQIHFIDPSLGRFLLHHNFLAFLDGPCDNFLYFSATLCDNFLSYAFFPGPGTSFHTRQKSAFFLKQIAMRSCSY